MTTIFGAEAENAVRRMAAGDDHVSTNVLWDFHSGIVGRAGEMAIPVAAGLAGILVAGGHHDEGSALVLDGVAVWSPPEEEDRASLVLVLPGAEGRRGVSTVAVLDERRSGTGAMRVRTFRGNWRKALGEMRSGGYVPDKMVDVTASIDMSMVPGRSGWLNLSSGRGYHDAWPAWFGALDRLARSVGIADVVDASAREFRSRTWIDPSESDASLRGYSAAKDAVAYAVSLDEGLPSVEARRFADAVEALAMGMDMTRTAVRFDAIVALCAAHGHGADGTDFDHNDLDNTVRVSDTAADGSVALHVTDQNCSLVLRASADRDRWAFWRARDPEVEPPLSSEPEPVDDEDFDDETERDMLPGNLGPAFAGTADWNTAAMTFTRMSDGFVPDRILSGGIGDVRSWNSLVIDIECALIELEEEYSPSPVLSA